MSCYGMQIQHSAAGLNGTNMQHIMLTSQTNSVRAFSSTVLAAAPICSVTYMPEMLYTSTAKELRVSTTAAQQDAKQEKRHGCKGQP